MEDSPYRKYPLLILIFSISLILSLTFGYPRIFLNDEWISANQLNHLMDEKDLLYGYEPYGEQAYKEGHGNVLCYTLALPIGSVPAYLLFITLGNHFRLFINVLWLGLIFLSLFFLHRFFPGYTLYKNIPWTYGVLFSSVILFILNMGLYTPFSIREYPEIAAIAFTNNLLFAGSMVLAFLIFRQIFENEWWSLFGVVSVICGSSYLFWSGVGKDHILVLFFFLISLYFFILWLRSGSLLHLLSGYIGIGWVAWARPEVGAGLFIIAVLGGMILAYREGIVKEVKTILCSLSVFLGATPLFINNLGVTGHVFTAPMAMGYQKISTSSVQILERQISTQFKLGFFNLEEFFQAAYSIFLYPQEARATGVFLVSPISFLAVFFVILLLIFLVKKQKFFYSAFEKKVVILLLFVFIGILLPYFRSFPNLGNDGGIIPDIRYLSLVYFPLVTLGLLFLERLKFDEQNLKRTLESFFWIAIVTLPLSLIVLQVCIGTHLTVQMYSVQLISSVLLGIVAVAILLVMMKKMTKKWLQFILPLLFISNCIWFLIIGYRFAGGIWEHYHFWLPVSNWTRLIILKIFP